MILLLSNHSFLDFMYYLSIYLSIYHLSVCLPIYPYIDNNNCSKVWLRVAVSIWVPPEADPEMRVQVQAVYFGSAGNMQTTWINLKTLCWAKEPGYKKKMYYKIPFIWNFRTSKTNIMWQKQISGCLRQEIRNWPQGGMREFLGWMEAVYISTVVMVTQVNTFFFF